MKTIGKLLLLFSFPVLFAACGLKGQTTVILLPQDNGHAGAVLVQNQRASTRLDTPYTFSRVASETAGFVVEKAEPEKVKSTYARLLAAEPPGPVHFILYFDMDAVTLTPASENLLDKIMQSTKEREPCEISIIGHADSMGTPDYNIALSLKRARAVAKILSRYDTEPRQISIQGFGEYDLLVSTPDETPEPRNRRVEIMIR